MEKKCRSKNPGALFTVVFLLTAMPILGRAAPQPLRCSSALSENEDQRRMGKQNSILNNMFQLFLKEQSSLNIRLHRMSDFEKVTKSHAVMSQQGVASTLSEKNQTLQITPIDNGHSLNQLALHLQEKMGVKIIYSPSELTNDTLAAYETYSKTLFISHMMAMSGIPDFHFFHEIRHASLNHKEKQGHPSWSEIDFHQYRRWWPFQRKAESSYEQYLSYQEIETWHQGAKYVVRGLVSHLQNKPSRSTTEVIPALRESRWRLEATLNTLEMIFDKTRLFTDALKNNNGYFFSRKKDALYSVVHFWGREGYYTLPIRTDVLQEGSKKLGSSRFFLADYLKNQVMNKITERIEDLHKDRDWIAGVEYFIDESKKSQDPSSSTGDLVITRDQLKEWIHEAKSASMEKERLSTHGFH